MGGKLIKEGEWEEFFDFKLPSVFYEERKNTDLDIVFVGLIEGKDFLINMIEGEFNQTKEEDILEAFDFAEKFIKKIIDFQKEIQEKCGQDKIILKPKPQYLDLEREIKEFLGDRFEKAFFQKDKNKRNKELDELNEELVDFIKEKYPNEEDKLKYSLSFLDQEADRLVHENVIKYSKRVDGRKLDEIRKIL